MATYTARFVEVREEAPRPRERLFRVVFDLAEEGVERDGSRREVVVPLAGDVVTAFWSKAPAFRPAPEWAAWFAATRHEVLEALVAGGETSVELERSETLADHLPPPGLEGEAWPPTRLRVATEDLAAASRGARASP